MTNYDYLFLKDEFLKVYFDYFSCSDCVLKELFRITYLVNLICMTTKCIFVPDEQMCSIDIQNPLMIYYSGRLLCLSSRNIFDFMIFIWISGRRGYLIVV